MSTHVELTDRPGLSLVPDVSPRAYIVRVLEDLPTCRAGDLLVVDPDEPIDAHDLVLVVLVDGGHLVGYTQGYLEAGETAFGFAEDGACWRQLDRNQVTAVHPVIWRRM